MGQPLLLEGEPGVGKTEAAKALAATLDTPLLRLQCYEGLTAAEALYEWNYPRQLLAIRLAESRGDRAGRADLFRPEYLLPRPLLAAIDHPGPRPAVLLIDEVDRADDEFEAFLFELLAEGSVTIPELGTRRAAVRPVAVLTSNRTRDLHDALKRRCLYHWIRYPGRGPGRRHHPPPGAGRLGVAGRPDRRLGAADARRSTCTSRPAWPRRSPGRRPWRRSACPHGTAGGRGDAGRGAQVRRGPAAGARPAGLAAGARATPDLATLGGPVRRPAARRGAAGRARALGPVRPAVTLVRADHRARALLVRRWPRWSPTRPRSRPSTASSRSSSAAPPTRRAGAATAARARRPGAARSAGRRTGAVAARPGRRGTGRPGAAGRAGVAVPGPGRRDRTAGRARLRHRCRRTNWRGWSAVMRQLRAGHPAAPLAPLRARLARAPGRPAHHPAAGAAQRRLPGHAWPGTGCGRGPAGWSCCATSPARWSRTRGPCCSWCTAPSAAGGRGPRCSPSPPG